MNQERWAGVCERLAGRLEERWGLLTRDRQRAAAGLGRQRAGVVRELRGKARETSRRELAQFHALHALHPRADRQRPSLPKAAVVSIAAGRLGKTA